jgi:hypothetical protein
VSRCRNDRRYCPVRPESRPRVVLGPPDLGPFNWAPGVVEHRPCLMLVPRQLTFGDRSPRRLGQAWGDLSCMPVFWKIPFRGDGPS